MRCNGNAHPLVCFLEWSSNFEAWCKGLSDGPIAKADRLQRNDQVVERYDEPKSMWAIATERREDCVEA
jgi:hypothetical protein